MIARNPNHPPTTARRGLASVAVLIALIVLGLIAAALLKVAFARRLGLGGEERRQQAGWLAESGVDRAVARLKTSSDYPGETWSIPAGDLGGRGTATVLIQVEKMADRAKVRVQADYPSGTNLRVRQSREIVVAIPSSSR